MSSEELIRYVRPHRWNGTHRYYTYFPSENQLWRVYANNRTKRMRRVFVVHDIDSRDRYVRQWGLTIEIPKYLQVDEGL